MELNFDEIGFVLDGDQYRDAISMVDMYHFYLRQYQYRRFRPADDEMMIMVNGNGENVEDEKRAKARAMLKFACRAISSEVHERRRKWTWDYLRERRDDRRRYIELFKKRERLPANTPLASQVDFTSLFSAPCSRRTKSISFPGRVRV